MTYICPLQSPRVWKHQILTWPNYSRGSGGAACDGCSLETFKEGLSVWKTTGAVCSPVVQMVLTAPWDWAFEAGSLGDESTGLVFSLSSSGIWMSTIWAWKSRSEEWVLNQSETIVLCFGFQFFSSSVAIPWKRHLSFGYCPKVALPQFFSFFIKDNAKPKLLSH